MTVPFWCQIAELIGKLAKQVGGTTVTQDRDGLGLRGLAALPEVHSAIPTLKATCNFSSGDPAPSSGL